LKENIASNRQSLDEETQIREKENAAFVARMDEHNEAVAAVDECL
jgi:hypothetical protein